MSPAELNVAVAELCGYVRHKFNKSYASIGGEGGPTTVPWPRGLPNYCGDLNAIAEAEKTLTPEGREDYIAHLWDELRLPRSTKFWSTENMNGLAAAIFASAEARARAFLATKRPRTEQ